MHVYVKPCRKTIYLVHSDAIDVTRVQYADHANSTIGVSLY